MVGLMESSCFITRISSETLIHTHKRQKQHNKTTHTSTPFSKSNTHTTHTHTHPSPAHLTTCPLGASQWDKGGLWGSSPEAVIDAWVEQLFPLFLLFLEKLGECCSWSVCPATGGVATNSPVDSFQVSSTVSKFFWVFYCCFCSRSKNYILQCVFFLIFRHVEILHCSTLSHAKIWLDGHFGEFRGKQLFDCFVFVAKENQCLHVCCMCVVFLGGIFSVFWLVKILHCTTGSHAKLW